jgi:hypothetical protein
MEDLQVKLIVYYIHPLKQTKVGTKANAESRPVLQVLKPQWLLTFVSGKATIARYQWLNPSLRNLTGSCV